MEALSVADYAEIYVIGPGISFPVAPRPETVRMVGCKYGIGRHALAGDTEWWRGLERSLRGLIFGFFHQSSSPSYALASSLAIGWGRFGRPMPRTCLTPRGRSRVLISVIR
jgi:hypothetical protein